MRPEALFKQLQVAGWQHVRISGGHHIFSKAKRTCIVVSVHFNRVRRDVESSALRAAGLRGRDGDVVSSDDDTNGHDGRADGGQGAPKEQKEPQVAKRAPKVKLGGAPARLSPAEEAAAERERQAIVEFEESRRTAAKRTAIAQRQHFASAQEVVARVTILVNAGEAAQALQMIETDVLGDATRVAVLQDYLPPDVADGAAMHTDSGDAAQGESGQVDVRDRSGERVLIDCHVLKVACLQQLAALEVANSPKQRDFFECAFKHARAVEAAGTAWRHPEMLREALDTLVTFVSDYYGQVMSARALPLFHAELQQMATGNECGATRVTAAGAVPNKTGATGEETEAFVIEIEQAFCSAVDMMEKYKIPLTRVEADELGLPTGFIGWSFALVGQFTRRVLILLDRGQNDDSFRLMQRELVLLRHPAIVGFDHLLAIVGLGRLIPLINVVLGLVESLRDAYNYTTVKLGWKRVFGYFGNHHKVAPVPPKRFCWDAMEVCMAKFDVGLIFIEEHSKEFVGFAQHFPAETLYDPVAILEVCVNRLWRSKPGFESVSRHTQAMCDAPNERGVADKILEMQTLAPSTSGSRDIYEKSTSCLRWALRIFKVLRLVEEHLTSWSEQAVCSFSIWKFGSFGIPLQQALNLHAANCRTLGDLSSFESGFEMVLWRCSVLVVDVLKKEYASMRGRILRSGAVEDRLKGLDDALGVSELSVDEIVADGERCFFGSCVDSFGAFILSSVLPAENMQRLRTLNRLVLRGSSLQACESQQPSGRDFASFRTADFPIQEPFLHVTLRVLRWLLSANRDRLSSKSRVDRRASLNKGALRTLDAIERECERQRLSTVVSQLDEDASWLLKALEKTILSLARIPDDRAVGALLFGAEGYSQMLDSVTRYLHPNGLNASLAFEITERTERLREQTGALSALLRPALGRDFLEDLRGKGSRAGAQKSHSAMFTLARDLGLLGTDLRETPQLGSGGG